MAEGAVLRLILEQRNGHLCDHALAGRGTSTTHLEVIRLRLSIVAFVLLGRGRRRAAGAVRIVQLASHADGVRRLRANGDQCGSRLLPCPRGQEP